MSKPRGLGLTQGSTLLAAALMDSPAIYHAFVAKDMPADTALARFLICVPVAAILLMVWHTIVDPYRRKGAPLRAVAERVDADDPDAPSPQPKSAPTIRRGSD
jgi:hypothetical protein